MPTYDFAGMRPTLCGTCFCLSTERRIRERAYVDLLGGLTLSADTGADYMSLRARVIDAEASLKLIETEFAQHQDRHTQA